MKFLSLLTRSAALVAVATTVTTPLLAYRIARINGAPNLGWSSGNIVMNLHFGTSFASGGTTVDGFPSYDGPVDAALAIWNQVLGRSSFTVIHNATFTPTLGDGKNSIYFATTTPLGAFPANAVAMTFLRYSGSRIIEADIVLNSAKLWNSYRGALLTANGGQPLNDIRRIALRELGRGLGLDYPDQDTPPQVVTAQMNFTTTPLDTLAQDDVDGIQTLYDVPVTNARFANLSTRGFTGTGDSVLIGGLVVEGSVSKRFYVRVLGPSLTGFGVVGALSDPTIELFGQGGNLLARNDNWKDTQEAEIRQTGFPPFDDRDCGLIATLPAGAFTGIVSGKNGATGVSIIEVYDFAPDNTVHLTNISTRGFVGAGDNVLIGGIVINGPEEQRIMVRVLAPEVAKRVDAITAHLNSWVRTLGPAANDCSKLALLRGTGRAAGARDGFAGDVDVIVLLVLSRFLPVMQVFSRCALVGVPVARTFVCPPTPFQVEMLASPSRLCSTCHVLEFCTSDELAFELAKLRDA